MERTGHITRRVCVRRFLLGSATVLAPKTPNLSVALNYQIPDFNLKALAASDKLVGLINPDAKDPSSYSVVVGQLDTEKRVRFTPITNLSAGALKNLASFDVAPRISPKGQYLSTVEIGVGSSLHLINGDSMTSSKIEDRISFSEDGKYMITQHYPSRENPNFHYVRIDAPGSTTVIRPFDKTSGDTYRATIDAHPRLKPDGSYSALGNVKDGLVIIQDNQTIAASITSGLYYQFNIRPENGSLDIKPVVFEKEAYEYTGGLLTEFLNEAGDHKAWFHTTDLRDPIHRPQYITEVNMSKGVVDKRIRPKHPHPGFIGAENWLSITSAFRDPVSVTGYILTDFAFLAESIEVSSQTDYFPDQEAENLQAHKLIPKDGDWKRTHVATKGLLWQVGSERYLVEAIRKAGVMTRRVTEGVRPEDPWKQGTLAVSELPRRAFLPTYLQGLFSGW